MVNPPSPAINQHHANTTPPNLTVTPSNNVTQAIFRLAVKQFGEDYALRWLHNHQARHAKPLKPTEPPPTARQLQGLRNVELPTPRHIASLIPKTPAASCAEHLKKPQRIAKGTAAISSAPQAPHSAQQDLWQIALARTEQLADKLASGQLRTFRGLYYAALKIAKARGYHPKTTQVTFFCPQEIIALDLGISRITLWRHLKVLLKHGLIDYRAHTTTTAERGIVKDGTVFSIRTDPRDGIAPKLHIDDLKHSYRDLDADIAAGSTAYAELQAARRTVKQSLPAKGDQLTMTRTLSWSLGNVGAENPVSNDYFTESLPLEALIDLPEMPPENRTQAVDRVAQTLCLALRDQHSHRSWCKLIWRMLKRGCKRRHFEYFYLMVRRVQADLQEGAVRSPGALLMWRMSQIPL